MTFEGRLVRAAWVGGLVWSCGTRTAHAQPVLELTQTLTATDGASSDWFGIAVSVSGSTILVGANQHAVGPHAQQGAVYVFGGDGGPEAGVGAAPSYQQTLVDDAGAAMDLFGGALALEGDTAIIGGWGSAYIFVRSGATWTKQQVLSRGGQGDDYGRSVALSGDTAIVGAAGAPMTNGTAHVYVRNGVTWSEQQVLSPPDSTSEDQFGISVGVSGDTAVVGARLEYLSTSPLHGAAYVFTRSGTTWTMQQKLVIPDMPDHVEIGEFGNAVAISSDRILVGAPETTLDVVHTEQGAAYMFAQDAGVWSLEQTIIPADTTTEDLFGYTVALSGNTAIIGAFLHRAFGHTGTAYVYAETEGQWWVEAELVGLGAQGDDQFTSSVALSSNTVVVGASKMTVGANSEQGMAFVGPVSGCAGNGCVVLGDAGSFPAEAGASGAPDAQSPGEGGSVQEAPGSSKPGASAGCGCRVVSSPDGHTRDAPGVAAVLGAVALAARRSGRRRLGTRDMSASGPIS